MKKTFTINEAPYSIRCLLYGGGEGAFDRVILFAHGFGGHKENGAARRFADYMLSKHKRAAVVCFDWPCHGEDVRKKLKLDDCDAYLRLVTEYTREKLLAKDLYMYATSFGGYLTLKYIADHGSPFKKVALRCPAVNMADVLDKSIMTDENRAMLSKGKEASVGFDRKIKVSADFMKELREADIVKRSFLDWAEDMLILHGTKDEIVPFDTVSAFADDNCIEFVPIRNADHRFMDPGKMTEAILRIEKFFAL